VDIKDAPKFKTAKKGNSNFALFFFEQPEEILKLQDGTKVCMLELWTKSDFEKIVNHAKQYGIEVADYKPREAFNKGGFRLEYLNGYVPPVPIAGSSKPKWWLWLALAAGIIGMALVLILVLLLSKKDTPVVERIIEREVVVKDTVYLTQLAEIEKNFNAAQFEAGKTNLSEDAKFVLHDLAKLLKNNAGLKLRIVGHTSKEGTEDFNQKLSEARAKAAVDFLVNERDIDPTRLEYKGVGSSQPLDEMQLDVNRRTEFIVIE
jgi:outer membrane protein OmpA-like peptidoglycan-associated protein